ncbi:MAG: hypothetical protein JST47_05610 [Bacteroidetes bacterium]|nr:hypothetical protein [Bacteroidota bacterium]MBS1973842.1 hypothetical protein [Bacteroidota bacterium]
MKKKIAMLTAAFLLTFGASFANRTNKEIPSTVKTDFSRHFSTAKNVQWEKVNDYYKASFLLGSNVLFAYYSDDDDFIGVAHNITSDKLPMMLQADLKTNYPNYWITSLAEYTVKHQPGYSISLESADQSIILKSDNLANWYVFRTVKKD